MPVGEPSSIVMSVFVCLSACVHISETTSASLLCMFPVAVVDRFSCGNDAIRFVHLAFVVDAMFCTGRSDANAAQPRCSVTHDQYPCCLVYWLRPYPDRL